MLEWLKSRFRKNKPEKQLLIWNELVPGDYVRVFLKDPEKVGIAKEHRSMTFQRLDSEDLKTMKLDGYVIQTKKTQPGSIETLEINVVKRRGLQTRLVVYLLLREEIANIEFLGEQNE